MLKDIVKISRSYRRFYQDKQISRDVLANLVDIARITPSASNRQPLKYMVFCDPDINQRIFECLAWAGYLPDWPGPEEGERPAGYIIILGDNEISEAIDCDHGIAAQTIMLAAAENGLGGCILGSAKNEKMRQVLDLPDRYEIMLGIALGYPKEKVVLEDVGPDGDIKYYRDENQVHHVPKRRLEDILIN